jgi:hypothetical protein
VALPREVGDVKPEKDDPVKRQKQRIRNRGRNPNKITRVQSIYLGYTVGTSGKGCVASKGTTRQASTVFLAVSVVNDLTLFLRSFSSGSRWDTREGSVAPEYVHSLETLACSG